jgi:tripartite-type tricarboxylate transporter receptor subunit TctC
MRARPATLLPHQETSMFNPSFRISRRRGLQALAAASLAGLGTLSGTAALAQDNFPSKPITILVPFAAGGTTDILARIVSQALQQELGQTVIVDNKPGAGGNIGAVAAARAPADGYTLFMGTVGTHAINAALYSKPGFDPIKDFAPLTRVANVPNLLVAHPSQPFKTVKEMIAYARANPGKLNYGSSGSGSSIHLSGELFRSMTGLDMVHVPYKGSAPAITDLLGNQIAIMFDNMPSAIQHVRSGKLRPIAVTTAKRSPELPDVPTIAESGVPGYEATSWFGLWTQAKTPAPIQQRLYTAIAKVLKDPAVIKKINDQGGDVVIDTPAEFLTYIKSESAKWSKVVKDSGAQV